MTEQPNSILQPLLVAWEWRPGVLLVIASAGALYIIAWSKLRRRGLHRLAAGRRLVFYLGGLSTLAVALTSPIDALGGQLFFMHMIQHLLLIMVAAPLLMAANPFPFFAWSLPSRMRRRLGGIFTRLTSRYGGRFATQPAVAWLIYVGVLLGWHSSGLYNLSLRNAAIHNLQHITFFGSALLYWWHVIGAGPHLHGRLSIERRIVYAIAPLPLNLLLGAFITLSPRVIYSYYATIPRTLGFSVMEDQVLGGIIMWLSGSMMHIVAALALIYMLLDAEDRASPWPEKSSRAMADTRYPPRG